MQADVVNFWNNLGKIQTTLNLSDEKFSQYLGISQKLLLTQKKQLGYLPLNCVFELAEKLNFHFEDLLQDKFCTSAIQNHLEGFKTIAEKYQKATYSTTRPVRNILNYLEHNRGERAKINFQRKFQISDSFLNDPCQKTNIHLITDAVDYQVKTHQFNNFDLLAIGQMTPLMLTNSIYSKNLTSPKNVYELVDYFVNDCAKLFDLNYHYRIAYMDNDSAVIEAIPRLQVLDELVLKPEQLGSEEVCITRMGVMSSLTWFKYHQHIKIKKISSIFSGDASHRYFLDLTPFNNLSRFPLKLTNTQAVYH